MNLKAIIVDDEPKALAILKNKIDRFCSNVIVVGESQKPKEAITLIEKIKPDLVFLDIAMPEMSGFDVLLEIQNPTFEIIFVTAFDQYAVDAINYCAIGYLLKPVDNEALIATVIKAEQNILDKTALEKNKQLIENLGVQAFQKKKIVIPTHEGLEFVEIKSIIFCEGTEGYTRIHRKEEKTILSSYSIGYFVKLLNDQEFYLIHKSYLININYIEKYLNEGYVILFNNAKLPVSRNKRTAFLSSLES